MRVCIDVGYARKGQASQGCKMKAAVLDQFGSVDVMQVRDIPVPTIGEGQILVEVHATNINPIDWKMREGQMAAVANQKQQTMFTLNLTRNGP